MKRYLDLIIFRQAPLIDISECIEGRRALLHDRYVLSNIHL